MSRIEIISASAGTGKTTRLAEIISDRVGEGSVRPEAVLATTFTKRAAAELAERARSKLLEDAQAHTAAGDEESARTCVDRAQRLHAARVGTVNSVCGGLVQEFAFEQGLAPRVAILDEDQARAELARVAGLAVSADLLAELARLEQRFGVGAWAWQRDAERIVDLARTNAIRAEDLAVMAEASVEGCLSLLSDEGALETADGSVLDDQLVDALAYVRDNVDRSVDTTNTTAKALKEVEGVLRRGVGRLAWSEWAKLAGLGFAKKSADVADRLHEAAKAHDRHPSLRADLAAAVRAVFCAAQAMLETYQEQKAQLGVIDFIDQETYALALLRKPEIRARLAEEIDLVLVDEFQDTSPIQLAIFLELAEIAPQTVWVGDPKQAIYGFRGADPALMEAAVEMLLEGDLPETLKKSWRSRPDLVRLTSDLFAPAFADSGIDEALVRIEPGREEEPEGLGSTLERWVLEPKPDPTDPKRRPSANLPNDFASLAEGVVELLVDTGACIRDRETGETRRIVEGDIGVLCLTKDHCVGVADALAERGVRAVVGRPGLLGTLEARLAFAALSLWIDPRDRLARAELARWLGPDPTGDAWLAEVLTSAREDQGGSERGEAEKGKTETREGRTEDLFSGVEAVAAVVAASEASPGLGVVAIFDAALAAAGIREAVLGFGDITTRLANLDALRGLVVRYVDQMRSAGQAVTPKGLLAHLAKLADRGSDEQSAADRPDAVRICTWHAAKGLEWPVTVLADIKQEPTASALGVRLASEEGAFSVESPLSGRSIAYWPTPYGKVTKGVRYLERLADHPESVRAVAAARREALRLVYVAWTRARDRLVLAARPGRLQEGRLSALAVGGVPLVSEPDEDGVAQWGIPAKALEGVDDAVVPSVAVRLRSLPPDVTMRGPAGASGAVGVVEGYLPSGPRVYPPASVTASSTAVAGAAVAVIELGERLEVRSSAIRDDEVMRHFGEAVHGFLAADRVADPASDRETMAGELLERWGVAGAVEPASVVEASDRLTQWLADRWPGATLRREWPLAHRFEGGTVLQGTADLVVETEDELVVIDHKSFPGNREAAVARAVEFAGQLASYADALRAATGKRVGETFIHLPISGLVVSVSAVEIERDSD